MKKRLLLFMLFIMMFIVTSCNTTNPNAGTTYSITYFNDTEIITLEPSSYVAGETVKLPLAEDLTLEAGYTFSGWYSNPTFSGNAVTSIKAADSGDKTFYAKLEKSGTDDPDTNKALADAIKNINSYKFTYNYKSTDNSDEFNCSYEYTAEVLKITYTFETETYVDYYSVENGVEYYYTTDEDGSYYKMDETDDLFDYYVSDLDYISFEDIKPADYTYENGYYVIKDATKVNQIAAAIIGSYENDTYTSFKIKVENGKISKIMATSNYVSDSSTLTYNYEINFSDYNTVSITLPNVVDKPITSGLTISQVYEQSENATVTTSGYVAGIIGNNVYIQDADKGIYVYFGSTNELLSELSTGVLIEVTGIKTTYKGLVELKEITSAQIKSQSTTITPTVLSDLSEQNLASKLSTTVSFFNATIVSLPSTYTLEGQDHSITISDGTNQTTLFISKYLTTEEKTAIFNVLKTLKVGNKINVISGTVSAFNSKQITCTNLTTVASNSGEVVVTKIGTNYTTKNVELETPFANVISDLIVTAYKSNGTTVDLAANDYTIDHSYNQSKVGSYKVTISYKSGTSTYTTKVTINVKAQSSAPFKPEAGSVDLLEDVIKTMGEGTDGVIYGVNRGISSTGNPKILVVPVEFNDYKAKTGTVENLQKAFFGVEADTGWESLNSYYKKASFNKLNISGTVLPVFNTGNSSTYYEGKEDGDTQIIKAILEYYDSTVNYADYDSDGDGYIDCLYLVYTAPISDSNESMYWAYTYEYFTDDYEYYDNVEADFYIFAGYDFLFEDFASGYNVKLNTETFIHETGHAIGLDDYYDSDSKSGTTGGIGGGDMMDYNIGDHNAFTKTILGWVTPTIANGQDCTITLNSFGSSGDCVIIPKGWNGSYFDEYYIVDFYTPDGLNAAEAGYHGLFSTSGIRIYHVDATLTSPDKCSSVWEIYKNNNSTTTHRLISLVEADGKGNIDYNEYSDNNDIFKVNSSFTNVKWYDNSDALFTLTVVSISNNQAVINIDYK